MGTPKPQSKSTRGSAELSKVLISKKDTIDFGGSPVFQSHNLGEEASRPNVRLVGPTLSLGGSPQK